MKFQRKILVTLTIETENASNANSLAKYAAKDIGRLYVFSDECKVKSAKIVPNSQHILLRKYLKGK